jgi:hypothetical protein
MVNSIMGRARAKMYLEQIEDKGEYGKRVHFRTMYDPELPEDQRFCKATPDGVCSMLITNTVVLERLERDRAEGRTHYYVDFISIPKPAPTETPQSTEE